MGNVLSCRGQCEENEYLPKIISSAHASEVFIVITLCINLMKTDTFTTTLPSIKVVLSIQVF